MRLDLRSRSGLLAARVLKLAAAAFDPLARLLRPYFEPTAARLRVRYERLEPREKTLVQIAAPLVFALLGYNLVYVPIQDLRADLQARIETRQHELLEVRRQVHNYQRLKLDMAAAEKQTVSQKDFSLFSALDGMLAGTVSPVSKIGSVTPGEDKKISNNLVQHSVEITLKGVSLQEIVDTLYATKTLPVPVLVSSIQIKRGSAITTVFDVDLTCVAVGRNG